MVITGQSDILLTGLSFLRIIHDADHLVRVILQELLWELVRDVRLVETNCQE